MPAHAALEPANELASSLMNQALLKPKASGRVPAFIGPKT